jgi:hypothetical protein
VSAERSLKTRKIIGTPLGSVFGDAILFQALWQARSLILMQYYFCLITGS